MLGGDIGCSSLPPHYPDWLTCMNSGTSIASGVGQALVETTSDRGRRPRVVSLVGDSTLFHSGLQTIIDCARRDSDQICFVLDNSWTAMTGHQSTPGTPRDLKGDRIEGAVDIPALLGAAGVRRLFTVDPLRVSRMRRLMMRLLEEPGFSCVVVRRECKLQVRRRGAAARWTGVFGVVEERCRRCNRCYSVLTCPAIDKLENGQIVIDPDLCGSCSLCHQTCPNGAIVQVRVRAAEAGPRRGRRGGEGEPP
ncbi:MAG: 4Fe-4S binding protein [Candidatus Riflebacteria bacterium]|nr:4Fe-4S binding protein [Candidatus Riflebacteria bacterium]